MCGWSQALPGRQLQAAIEGCYRECLGVADPDILNRWVGLVRSVGVRIARNGQMSSRLAQVWAAVDAALAHACVTDVGSQRGLSPGQIWVDRLLEPGRIADQGTRLVFAHAWQEGPVLWPLEAGRYRLTYSLGAWTDDTYRVTQAVADRPDGPFRESDQIRIRTTAAVKGPGHHNFFVGPMGPPGWSAMAGIQR